MCNDNAASALRYVNGSIKWFTNRKFDLRSGKELLSSKKNRLDLQTAYQPEMTSSDLNSGL